jgi:hypothetical protein
LLEIGAIGWLFGLLGSAIRASLADRLSFLGDSPIRAPLQAGGAFFRNPTRHRTGSVQIMSSEVMSA